MPIYKEIKELPGSKNSTKLFVFDRSEVTSNQNKQMACLESCITMGTKMLNAVDEDLMNKVLTQGQEFNGYYIRTVNGPYDYCYKIWTERRLPFAPLNVKVPHEDEPQDAIIIDRNEDLLGLASGPHLAYCSLQSIDDAGYSLDQKTLPIAGIRVKLRKQNENRPSAIPYAAFEAIPVPEDYVAEIKEEIKIEFKTEHFEG